MWPHKKKSKEDIPDGCFLQEWQTQSHPNCNLLHELDLKVLLRHSNDLSRTTSPSTSGKYLSSGMWRDVYSIPVHFEQVVLKLMKKEHDVNWRNFERHRREAIVMDVLTKSPNIVDLYSFCGNTVLTEYLPMDLENYLKEQQQAKPRQKRANYIDRNLVTTPQQRLNMAYQTAKALKDLHELDVMHADLQAKQFLVTSSNNNEHGAGDIITIKLNDFNRCRFLPRRPSGENTTIPKGSICPIHIPSAPGKARSPEEYEMKELTTQIDIYSLANVWFRILTGRRPWEEERLSSNIKSSIMAGQKPPLPDWLTFDAGGQSSPSDISLAVLLSLAYHLDPQKRATAINLVHEVERLIVTVH
jgi:serine/threonine protein kinase